MRARTWVNQTALTMGTERKSTPFFFRKSRMLWSASLACWNGPRAVGACCRASIVRRAAGRSM